MTRRGFTALEMIVATSISVVVLGASLGIFGFMDRAARVQEQRYKDLAEMAILHETVRRAMQSLVAEPPVPGEAQGGRAAPGRRRPTENPDAEDPERRTAREKDSGVRQIDASGRAIRERPRFLLEPQIPGQRAESDPRRLEIVVMEQPAPGPLPVGAAIRGVFEIAPMIDGYALQWKSLDPPGLPVVLATRLAEVRWTALAKESMEKRYEFRSGAWRGELAGATIAEFPKAVRLELTTLNGTHMDWLFEPAVTTGPSP